MRSFCKLIEKFTFVSLLLLLMNGSVIGKSHKMNSWLTGDYDYGGGDKDEPEPAQIFDSRPQYNAPVRGGPGMMGGGGLYGGGADDDYFDRGGMGGYQAPMQQPQQQFQHVPQQQQWQQQQQVPPQQQQLRQQGQGLQQNQQQHQRQQGQVPQHNQQQQRQQSQGLQNNQQQKQQSQSPQQQQPKHQALPDQRDRNKGQHQNVQQEQTGWGQQKQQRQDQIPPQQQQRHQALPDQRDWSKGQNQNEQTGWRQQQQGQNYGGQGPFQGNVEREPPPQQAQGPLPVQADEKKKDDDKPNSWLFEGEAQLPTHSPEDEIIRQQKFQGMNDKWDWEEEERRKQEKLKNREGEITIEKTHLTLDELQGKGNRIGFGTAVIPGGGQQGHGQMFIPPQPPPPPPLQQFPHPRFPGAPNQFPPQPQGDPDFFRPDDYYKGKIQADEGTKFLVDTYRIPEDPRRRNYQGVNGLNPQAGMKRSHALDDPPAEIMHQPRWFDDDVENSGADDKGGGSVTKVFALLGINLIMRHVLG